MMHRWRRYRCRRRQTADARVSLVIYERSDELGQGPAMSVYRHGTEVLRFDLFAPAHVHRMGEPTQPRHYYETNDVADNVEHAIRELIELFPGLSYADTRWIRSELEPPNQALASGKPMPEE